MTNKPTNLENSPIVRTDPAQAALESSLRSIEARLAAIEVWLTNFDHRLGTLENRADKREQGKAQ